MCYHFPFSLRSITAYSWFSLLFNLIIVCKFKLCHRNILAKVTEKRKLVATTIHIWIYSKIIKFDFLSRQILFSWKSNLLSYYFLCSYVLDHHLNFFSAFEINPFQANFPILCSLETSKALCVFRGYNMGKVTRGGLIKYYKQKKCFKFP